MTTPAPNCADLETLIPRIAARARRLTRDPDKAQDLAQETALRLLQKLSAPCDIDNLEAYAMITMRNLASSSWRAAQVTEELRDDHLSCGSTALDRLAVSDLMCAITRLPEDQAALMTLVAHGETSPAALSDLTGVPVGTVMSRLGRARSALRVDLDLPKADAVSALISVSDTRGPVEKTVVKF